MEGKEYPIFLMMYHPEFEYKISSKESHKGNEIKEITDEIAFRISLVMN